jgi:hypothetical protein
VSYAAPSFNREAAYAALAAAVQTAWSWTSPVSRRLPPSNEVGVPEQPCAFVPVGREVAISHPESDPQWNLATVIWVYARTEDPSTSPGALLTPIVAALEAALRWQPADGLAKGKGPGTWGTLGKTCEHCEITAVEYGEGVTDGQGIAFLHVEILGVAS